MAIIDISDSTKRIWVVGGTVATGSYALGVTGWSAGNASYSAAVPHGYSAGWIITISGATPSGYNVSGVIHTVTATTFKIAMTVNPGAYVSGGTMTPQCIIGSPIDLNDYSNTFMLPGTSLGRAVRGESWIQPKVPGAAGVLAQYWDEPPVMTLSMRLKYTNTGALITGANAIRSAFDGANTLWQSYKGQTNLRSFTTYRSPIDPLVVGEDEIDRFKIAESGEVRRWTIQVRRQPWADGTTTLPL